MLELRKHHIGNDYYLFLFVISIIVFTHQYFFKNTPIPSADAIKYIEYGINIKDLGVFGLTDANQITIPGNENTPLFPFLIYIASSIDNNLYTSLSCLLEAKNNSTCELNFAFFVLIQSFLIIIALSCIWLLSKHLGLSITTAWISSLFAYLSGEFIYFSNMFLTETLLMTLFFLFILFLSFFLKTRNLIYLCIISAVLGLLTLTRPEYIYLFYVLIILLFIAVILLANHRKFLFKALFVSLISYFFIVSPWLIRNHHHFGNYSLTSSYAVVTLSQRVAYNQMTWKEWGVAFIYWFPDCGDSISKRLFQKENYEKLSFESNSYYSEGAKSVINKANQKIESKSELLLYLLKNEVMENALKHGMVTIPLLWRGLFISKYWGVLGLFSFFYIVFFIKNDIKNNLVILSLPAWFLALLHALVSVNIARYNIILIPFYSITMAIVFHKILCYLKNSLYMHYKNKHEFSK